MSFPPRPAAGTSALDGPPPSPTAMSGGGDTPFSMRGLTGGVPGMPSMPAPSGQIPPEILTGAMQTAQTVGSALDAFAQLFPAESASFGMLKDLLQQTLARITQGAMGATLSPTASGPAFPGGGIDRGIAGPGAV